MIAQSGGVPVDLGQYAVLFSVLCVLIGGFAGAVKWLDLRTQAAVKAVHDEYEPQLASLEARIEALENGRIAARGLMTQALEESTEPQVKKYISQALAALR